MMRWLGVLFETDASDFDEKQIRHTSPKKLTQLLAIAKAEAVVSRYPDAIVIGSDAVVSFEGQILEKPKNEAHQRELLYSQHGRDGKVFASVCIIDTAGNRKVTKTDTVTYKLAHLTDEQIETYIASGKGLDKAGGFGLQDDNGLFVDKLDGCFPTAMGFPICEVATMLREMGTVINTDVKRIAETKTGRSC